MEKKRIIIYKTLDEPHRQQLKNGLLETPEERYRGFFAMQARLWALKGHPKFSKSITIRKPSWI